MSVEAVIYTKLAATSALTALLAAAPEGLGVSIYRGLAPQQADKPYITYRMISANLLNQSLGGDTSGAGVMRGRFQFDCYANKSETVKDIADALRAALDGWTEVSGGDGFPAVVGATMQELEQDVVIPPADDSESPIYQVSMDFMIHWSTA